MKKLFTSFALFFCMFSFSQAGHCPGEFNCDGLIGTADLLILIGEFGTSGPSLVSDMNCDGTVNTADLTLFLGLYGTSCCLGDMNHDDNISAGDFTIWLSYFSTGCLQGDLNCDGAVDTNDLLQMLGVFGTSCTGDKGSPSKRLSTTDAILEVYPNPTTDKITINSALALDLPEVSIEVRDFTGRLVSKHQGTSKIDISELETGTYIVQMRIHNILVESQKVLKY